MHTTVTLSPYQPLYDLLVAKDETIGVVRPELLILMPFEMCLTRQVRKIQKAGMKKAREILTPVNILCYHAVAFNVS